MSKYTVNNSTIESILGWIHAEEIAIPEIQRPFVWNASKVRDLMDSLYQGFPVGYVITWRNPDTKLKDGTQAIGKKILIDGQQRITALTAALLGQEVVRADYKKKRIRIAFNPIEERFEVANPAIEKDSAWISDIASFFQPQFNLFEFVNNYCQQNEDVNSNQIGKVVNHLVNIRFSSLGMIELSHELDIETVTEIFIRINSQGVVLSQADFVMSKIAVNESYNGINIRKMIDYFCHLAKNPADYEAIKVNDKAFSSTDYFQKIKWIKKHTESLYVPDYSDLLRVAFTFKFLRGKLANLVSLLSGRDFETREYKEEITEESFKILEEGVLAFVNETNFKRFLMIVKSTGIIHSSLIRSQHVLNFGYILYLSLRDKGIEQAKINKVVRRWIVLSMLTARYSSSPESTFEFDIRRFNQAKDIEDYLYHTEEGELSDAFWSNILVSRLNTSVTSSPFFHLFLMAQIRSNDKAFLSKATEIKHLIEERGDLHHIFPKKYLQSNGFNSRNQYNQIANYVYTQQEINIVIKHKSPDIYMKEIEEQCNKKTIKYGEIQNIDELLQNLEANCIPSSIFSMNASNYELFLEERRKLMAKKIRDFYSHL
ncbi:GmrSD restriction endonuclease domain-containing protein [Priestia megaterium]|uniref:GmrSD restriction endonuclease domain-containing protein n=1 Tax=Priestia megaterium TaxID=1404 RepID=UPI00300A48FD